MHRPRIFYEVWARFEFLFHHGQQPCRLLALYFTQMKSIVYDLNFPKILPTFVP